jgi:hypothetical protein
MSMESQQHDRNARIRRLRARAWELRVAANDLLLDEGSRG